MTFLVDENLENYQEIHGWLRGLGFSGGHEEFKKLLDGGSDRFPTSKNSVLGDEKELSLAQLIRVVYFQTQHLIY